MKWIVLEYEGPPFTPYLRHVLDFGFGPVEFEADIDDAMAFFQRLGGPPSAFRVVPVAYAVKMGLMQEKAA